MTAYKVFEFSPFAENTYVVYDETGECAIVDPGCFSQKEKETLRAFIEEKGLKPVRLWNTHCHLDHIFGNKFVFDTWNLLPECHEDEVVMLQNASAIAKMYGIPVIDASPKPQKFIKPNTEICFGNSTFKVFYTPGHSPASLSFYNAEADFVLAGDVLFYESIGRVDLPGGDMDTLLESIRTQLFTLPNHTIVLPGHGPETTVRHEKEYNPFLS